MKDYEVKLKVRVFGYEILIRKALPARETH